MSKAIDSATRARIRALHDRGWSGAAIAKHVGVSPASVSGAIGHRSPRTPRSTTRKKGGRVGADKVRRTKKPYRCSCGSLVYPSDHGCAVCAANRAMEQRLQTLRDFRDAA